MCPKVLKHWCLIYIKAVNSIWERNQLNVCVCVCKYSDVTPYVIINIFICNRNLQIFSQ